MDYNFKLYSDFDGVYHAHEIEHEHVREFTVRIEESKYLSKDSIVIYSPTVVDAIEALRDEFKVELVWATSWNEGNHILTAAREFGGPLAGGRVLEARLNEHAKDKAEWTRWKADAIIADQYADPKPFVWVDDNAHRYHTEAVKAATHGIPSLFLAPNSSTGLTVKDLDTIQEFFASHAGN